MAEVSIIVPIFNIPEKFFNKCIDSILSQTMEQLELILVDDGNEGKNNLPEICDKFAKKDSRVKVIHQENKGVSYSRNVGIKQSTSKYIMFIDADDWINTDTLKNVIQLSGDYIDIVLWEYMAVKQEGLMEESNDRLSPDIVYTYSDQSEIEIMQRSVICSRTQIKEGMNGAPVCKLYKREILMNHNIEFDEKLPRSQDNEFNFKYFQFVKKAVYLEKKLYYYRRFSESATNKYRVNARSALETYLDKIYQDLNEYQKNDYFFADYHYIVFNKFIDICKTEYAHPLNNIKIKQRSVEIKGMAESDRFSNAIKNINRKELSVFEKVCFSLLKYNCHFVLIYLFFIRYIVLMRKSR